MSQSLHYSACVSELLCTVCLCVRVSWCSIVPVHACPYLCITEIYQLYQFIENYKKSFTNFFVSSVKQTKVTPYINALLT
jgi:hypothetical protein